jgi:hypothetical protein
MLFLLLLVEGGTFIEYIQNILELLLILIATLTWTIFYLFFMV